MKVYKVETDYQTRYAGTQADAKALVANLDAKGFEQMDIPTDKPSLLAFINDLCEQCDVETSDEES